MIKLINKTYTIIYGEDAINDFDKKIITTFCLIVILVLIIACIANFLLGLSHLVITTATGVIIFSILYFIARYKGQYIIAKWLTQILLFVYLDILWYTNFGSNGPIIYAFISFYSGFLILWSGRIQKLFIVMFFINLAGMFTVEMVWFDKIGSYKDPHQRIIDLYTSLVLYVFIASYLILMVKRNMVLAREKAEKSDKLKTIFLANISHEIRTPMNAIMGFSKLLDKENISNDKRREYIKIINSNSNYLLLLINDLIDISKIESDQMDIYHTLFNLEELLEEVRYITCQQAEFQNKNRLEINYLKPEKNFFIYTDRVRLKQILINLLNNAIKYTDYGQIFYGCNGQEGNLLPFFVKDTGIGIDPEAGDSIFERFVKTTSSGNKIYRGTGIGLSITKYLVEKLEGKIWYESKRNEGTTFYFIIKNQHKK